MSEFTHLLGSNPTTGAIPQDVVDYIAAALPDSGTPGTTVTDHGALTGLDDDDHDAVYVRYTIGPEPPASPRAGDFWLVTA